ncbi:MAG: glycoside hydrolase family 28 protein [Chitinophagaceae bacterium]
MKKRPGFCVIGGLMLLINASILLQPAAAQHSKKTLPLKTVTLASFPGYKGKLPVINQPVFPAKSFNIKSYGAKADGVFLNSKAINSAIDACSKAAGGMVIVPQGLWLTGPIVLQNNVNLHLEKNALVQFTDNFDEFPLVESSFEGVAAYRCQSPVSASHASNIAITGEGIFDGAGSSWRPQKKDKLTESEWKNKVAAGGVLNENKTTWYSSPKALKGELDKNIGKIIPGKPMADYEAIKDFLRPNFLRIFDCKNVILQGVTFQNSPAWTLHFLESEHITVKAVKVKNPWYGQNTDAIDLESCKNAFLEDNVFDTGDDGICIKSGRDEEGRKKGMPTENVIVNNCLVYHAHGGFVVGSEMSGGARNMFITNSTFMGTDIGLRFKTKRGRGGVVENIHMANIDMKDIAGEAILFDMYYEGKDPVPLAGETVVVPPMEILPVTEATPIFRNFFISNITCSGASKGIFVRGLPEMRVKNVNIENCVLQTTVGMYCEEGDQINVKNVKLLSHNTSPVMTVHNSSNLVLNEIYFPKNTRLLLKIDGERTAAIKLIKTDISNAKKEVEFSGGATPSSYVKK